MTFESFIDAQSYFLWSIFIIALLMGALVNKTNFCTMGAVSDMVNIGDYGRRRSNRAGCEGSNLPLPEGPGDMEDDNALGRGIRRPSRQAR